VRLRVDAISGKNRGVSHAGASSGRAQMGPSLSLPGCELFLALLNAYILPTQHPSPCKPARALAPRLPRSEEVWYAG
jgi:hypothetical protein